MAKGVDPVIEDEERSEMMRSLDRKLQEASIEVAAAIDEVLGNLDRAGSKQTADGVLTPWR